MCLDKTVLLYTMDDATFIDTVVMAKSSLLNLEQQHVRLHHNFIFHLIIYKQ